MRPAGGGLARLLGSLQLGEDPGEALGEGVVDLPRHPLAFVVHPGLAGLHQQLGVQPRVLLGGLLQPHVRLVQGGERLALFHGPVQPALHPVQRR